MKGAFYKMRIGCRTLMNSERNKIQTKCNIRDLAHVYLLLVLPTQNQFTPHSALLAVPLMPVCSVSPCLCSWCWGGSHCTYPVHLYSSFPEFTSGVTSRWNLSWLPRMWSKWPLTSIFLNFHCTLCLNDSPRTCCPYLVKSLSLSLLIFLQLYSDIFDIQHCVSLRYTVWFDTLYTLYTL